MAVTIWAMNRMPTLIATPLLDLGWRSLDDAAGVGVVVVLMVLIGCPFGAPKECRDSNGVRLSLYDNLTSLDCRLAVCWAGTRGWPYERWTLWAAGRWRWRTALP